MPTEVEIRILNVGDSRGTVRVALCTAAQWLKPEAVAGAVVPAEEGVMRIVVPDVPPGTYGVLVHHDANADGEINRDFLGRPTEGIGFSRDAPMLFGPPRFKDAAVVVAEERVCLDVTLRFEPKPSRRS